MRRVFGIALIGFAALVWAVGLGMAFGTDTGLLLIPCAAALLAMKFRRGLLEGHLLEDFRDAAPNHWTRKYILLFGYLLFAFPGFLKICGEWVSASDPSLNPYYLGSPYSLDRVSDWPITWFVAAVVPAMIISIWSERHLPRRTKNPQQPAA